ncbi:hypothetical protein [Microbacterium sp. zg.Y909]|uniref:hypothetical protein n=1 Tax=Microbacterium sp. zg.Y909 TaxID=2969413 RepID=UPI00214C6381|nr:hypothetical protein [Microbacterium sp. zg.Y909]MCR2827158.1 hypothetical protein [Microbacterium sp. zg.Y909]
MKAHGAIGAVTSVVLVLVLTGCVPEPEPAPTPTATGFASEAEAFAAAEETYRAYVDALNQVDLSDPDTFEAVYAWTTGEANANERETLSEMHAEGWTKSGVSQVIAYRGDSTSRTPPALVVGTVCVDVSTIAVVDGAGASMVSPERPDRYNLSVEMTASKLTSTGLQIAASNAVEGDACAP